MPSIYAHYRFGSRLLPLLDEATRQLLEKERRAFDLGLQGPDIFYYGSVFCGPRGRVFADRLHGMSGRDIFEAYFSTAGLKKGESFGALTERLSAYMLGFVGHFTLDSVSHPYIDSISQDAGKHLALETDLDAYFLEKDGIKPWTCMTHKICPPSGLLLPVLLEFYAPFSAGFTPREVVRAAIHAHRALFLRRTPTRWRYRLLTWFLRRSRQAGYESVLLPPPDGNGQSRQQWPDKPEEALSILEKLFEDALPLFRDNVAALRQRMEAAAPLPVFFDRNFNQY